MPPCLLAPDYATARRRFRETAAERGARLQEFAHPETGPCGEPIALDLAEFGPPDAPAAVLVVCGTHGGEGFAGSALQHRWLSDGAPALPADLRLLFVHAMNPYGFAWMRRVDEANIDVNRNYIDWRAPAPANSGYDALAELLVPRRFGPGERERSTQALLERARAQGFDAFQQVITCGQYTHPDGIFYGGRAPSWSHRFVERLCSERLARLERLAVIDLHTGLGEWGHGELISSTTASHPSHQRSCQWYGEVCSQVDGDSVSKDLNGEWLSRLPDWLPATEVTPVALEFGTVDAIRVLQALRADAWLHAHGDPRGPEADAIKREMRRVFADDDPKWLEALWTRFARVLGQAFAGVGRAPA